MQALRMQRSKIPNHVSKNAPVHDICYCLLQFLQYRAIPRVLPCWPSLLLLSFEWVDQRSSKWEHEWGPAENDSIGIYWPEQRAHTLTSLPQGALMRWCNQSHHHITHDSNVFCFPFIELNPKSSSHLQGPAQPRCIILCSTTPQCELMACFLSSLSLLICFSSRIPPWWLASRLNV